MPRRRSPAETRAWLLLILFVPVPGAILFLVIGRAQFPRWRQQRFRALLPLLSETRARLAPHEADLGTATPIAALATQLGSLPAVGGNRVELLEDYEAVVAQLIADIDAATGSVHLLVYIFADDAVGIRIADALGRARVRGVEVRVMFDSVGSHRWRRSTLRRLRRYDVRVEEALPFRLLRYRTRRDMRNHRKLFVIDDRIGYAGSQNIVARDFRRGVVNCELVARVTGPIVAGLSAVVRGDWTVETGEQAAEPIPIPSPTGTAIAQLLPSGPDYPLRGFQSLLVWQLHRAERQVTIVTPYFIPDDSVLNAMTIAAARGVTVSLIVSKVVDQWLVNLAQSSFYEEPLAAGVRIYRFRDYLLHAKTASVDGQLAVVGSSNVDLRSFQLNEEASLLLYDAASIAAVEAIQRRYLAASDALELVDWNRRAAWRRILENIARLMNSLL